MSDLSTTVEITIGYLTSGAGGNNGLSTTVEITIGYLTIHHIQGMT